MVVTEVTNIGRKLIRILSVIASFLLLPNATSCRMVTSKCTASAIAIIGADMTGGDNKIPDQPASPMAVNIERKIITTVATVALMLRNMTNNTSMIKPKASGYKFATSSLLASGKALFIIAIPTRRISTLEYFSNMRCLISRADATAFGTSSRAKPGNCMVAFMPANLLSGEINRCTSMGSLIAIDCMRIKSLSVNAAGSGTKSSTIKSSSSAKVC